MFSKFYLTRRDRQPLLRNFSNICTFLCHLQPPEPPCLTWLILCPSLIFPIQDFAQVSPLLLSPLLLLSLTQASCQTAFLALPCLMSSRCLNFCNSAVIWFSYTLPMSAQLPLTFHWADPTTLLTLHPLCTSSADTLDFESSNP